MSLASDHSLVGTAAQDQRYVGLCGVEQLGYFGLGHGASEFSDFRDFLGAQNLLVGGDAANLDGVQLVADVIRPFEVGSYAIRLNPVNVIDDRKVVGIRDESKSHQTVNEDRLAFPVSEKIDILVSEFVRAWSENLPIHRSSFQPVADAVQASDTAEIADLVKISEVRDRNGSPFFLEGDIHLAGCLSGYNGLAIKDPPHASTFGGSAHYMGSASDNYNRRLLFL